MKYLAFAILLLAACAPASRDLTISYGRVTEKGALWGERQATLDRTTTVTFANDGLTTRTVASHEYVSYQISKTDVMALGMPVSIGTGALIGTLATAGNPVGTGVGAVAGGAVDQVTKMLAPVAP